MISKDFLRTNKFSKDSIVKEYIPFLIDFLNETNQAKYFIDEFYNYLQTKVSGDIAQYDFIVAVFYLARLDLEITIQKFETLHENVWVIIEIDSILEYLGNKPEIYRHPITNVILSEEEFILQVRTYFIKGNI